MRRLWSEIGLPTCLFIGAIFLFRESLLLPPPRFEPMGPGFFPKCLLVGIMLLTAWNILLGLLRLRRGEPAKTAQDSSDDPWRMPVVAALFTAYIAVVVFTDIPFLFLAAIFNILLGFLLSGWNRRALRAVVLSTLGVVASIYLIFGVLLQSFFP